MRGRLFALVGPSGAGKDTLIAGALAAGERLNVVRRVITRPEDPGGEPHDPASEAAFEARRRGGEFALSWQAHGLHYGIPKLALAPLDRCEDVLFNGSREALPLAVAQFPELIVLHISARPEVLARRLLERGRESPAEVAARVKRAKLPLPAGLKVIEVDNSTSREAGIARLIAALQPASL